MRTLDRMIRDSLQKLLPRRLRNMKSFEYFADGLGVRGKNLTHLSEARFAAAWEFALEGNREGWAHRSEPPDLRWRASVCCWAAQNALAHEGDFVECGVHTGLLSMTVCHFLGFENLDRRFFLCDTFEGIPRDGLTGREADLAEFFNTRLYSDVWELVQRNFAPYPNVSLVRGRLPGTLAEACPKKIAYLSIDLNIATFEKQTIEALWQYIVPGAAIVIDDYGFRNHESQYEMWNAFAASQGTAVLALPTGQGLLIRPPQ